MIAAQICDINFDKRMVLIIQGGDLMILSRSFLLIVMLVSFFFSLAVAHGEEGKALEGVNVVLRPADQMILEAIDKVNERIDKVALELNGRIDNLWITMLGGFLGVMAFIGGIVFWDRRTFLRRAREEFRSEITEDRQKLEAILAAMRKLGNQFPEVRETLKSFGLL